MRPCPDVVPDAKNEDIWVSSANTRRRVNFGELMGLLLKVECPEIEFQMFIIFCVFARILCFFRGVF